MTIALGRAAETVTIAHGQAVETVTIAHGLTAETVTIAHGPVAETVTIAHGPVVEIAKIAHGPAAETGMIAHDRVTETSQIVHVLAETVNEEARTTKGAPLAGLQGDQKGSREVSESLAKEDAVVLRSKKVQTFPFDPLHRMNEDRRAVRMYGENDREPLRQMLRIVIGRDADPVRKETLMIVRNLARDRSVIAGEARVVQQTPNHERTNATIGDHHRGRPTNSKKRIVAPAEVSVLESMVRLTIGTKTNHLTWVPI
jgi:hypothetical protein